MTTPDSRRPDAGPGPETGRTEKRWTLPGDVHVVSVFGMRDEVLRTVERGFPHLSVLARGHDVTLTGPADDVAVAARLLSAAIDGPSPTFVSSILIEGVIAALLLFARAILPHHRVEDVGV